MNFLTSGALRLVVTGILHKKKTMWFIGVEVEQETSAPPPKKNPGSTPVTIHTLTDVIIIFITNQLLSISTEFQETVESDPSRHPRERRNIPPHV